MTIKKFLLSLFLIAPLSANASDINTHGSFNFHGGSLPINSETTITVDGVSYSIGQLITNINEASATVANIGTQITQIENTSNTAYTVATSASTNAQNALNVANSAIPKSWIDVISTTSITGVPSLNTNGYIHSPLDSTTVVHGTGTTLDGKTLLNVLQAIDTNTSNISSITTTANNAIPLSQKGQANGVATLDNNKNVTAPFLTTQGIINRTYTAPDGSTSTVQQINLNNDGTTNITVGGEATTFGGVANSNNTVSHKSLIIQGMPYGPYDLGCVTCVFSSADSFDGGGSQAAISGKDYRSGATAIAQGDMATVMSYKGFVNQHVRFTATASSYTSNTVTLSTPMTTEQMSQLQPGMYITTNSVDPDCTTALDSTGVYNDCRIRGIISTWTADTITVYGWGRMGGSTSGVTPSTTNLDTVYTTSTSPLVFVGGGGKSFEGNDYLTLNADNSYGTDSLQETTNHFEIMERDTRLENVSAAHPYSFHGTTESFQCIPCTATVNPDSYMYLVNGPGLGRAYVAQMDGDGLEFSGYNTWLPGNGYPTATGANHIMFDFDSSLSTNNNLHFGAQVVKSLDDSSSWADWEVRLGLNIDGTRIKDVMTGGSNMSQLAWNHSGASGSLSILTPSGNVGFSQDSSGNGTFSGIAYFKPSSISNGLIPGFIACDSYTICTAGNIGATVSILASSLEAVKDGTGQSGFPSTDTRSVFSPDGYGNWTTTGSIATSSSLSASKLELSSASYNSDGTVGGQGLLQAWNTISLGSAYTELVNVDPGTSGGLKFYDTVTGNKPNDSNAITLMNGAGLLVYKNLTVNGNTYLSTNLTFSNSVNANAFYWNLSGDGKTLTAGTQVSGGANMDGINSLSASSLNISGSIVIPFSTPSDSSTCTKGQLSVDDTYIYSCSSTNTWMKVSLDTMSLTTYTYSTLPSSPTTDTKVYCTDCYSKLRESDDTETGIEVTWNGSRWNDAIGIAILH